MQNRSDILIKVDVQSGVKQNLPKKAGPGFNEVPKEISIKEFETDYLATIKKESDKNFILQAYNKTNDKFI